MAGHVPGMAGHVRPESPVTLLRNTQFDSVQELEAGLKEYIHYYNHERIRLKLKGLSPVQYRVQSFGGLTARS